MALPNTTSPSGITLSGTSLLGEAISTRASIVPGTISTSNFEPFSSYATNGISFSVVVPTVGFVIFLTSTRAFTVAICILLLLHRLHPC